MDRKEIAIAVCGYALKDNDADTFVKSFAEYAKECLKDKDNKSKEENKTNTKQEDNDSEIEKVDLSAVIKGEGWLPKEEMELMVKKFGNSLAFVGFKGSVTVEVKAHE